MLDQIADSSGSHTLEGIKPSFNEGLRYTKMQEQTQIDYKQITKLFGDIESAICKVDSKLKLACMVFSAYAGTARVNELQQIKQELENLRCTDLSNPREFGECLQKFREISRKLNKIG